MRDEMKIGDEVLYYHSNAKPPAIVGLATVCRESYPDFTAFDPENSHYDPKSSQTEPRWMMVDIRFKQKFDQPLSLDDLREIKALSEMELLRKGSRLSVQPVRKKEYDAVIKLAESTAKQEPEKQDTKKNKEEKIDDILSIQSTTNFTKSKSIQIAACFNG